VKSTVEEAGPWRKTITITLEPEEVDRERVRILADYRRRAAIPGFRKGKAPEDMIKQHYGDSVEKDVLDHILPEATKKAIVEHALQPAAAARIQVQDHPPQPGEPLTFLAVVDVWPQLAVTGYEGAELSETLAEVDDESVDRFLQALRERLAEISRVDRPSQPGDLVEASLIDVDVNGAQLPRAKRQTIRIEAGESSLPPEFREVSVGVRAGDVRLVSVESPPDPGAPEATGAKRHYRMRVRQVMEKKLPVLDDAFAERVNGTAGLEALRSGVRQRLEADERLRGHRRTEEALVDLLIERNPFDVPEAIMGPSLAQAFEKAREEDPRIEEEEFRRVYTPVVERVRKREILLESIARQESIKVGEEELDAEISRSARPGVDPRAIRRRLEKDHRLDRVRDELLERKTLDFLFEKVTINRAHEAPPRPSNIIVP
jgi:trigger factor